MIKKKPIGRPKKTNPKGAGRKTVITERCLAELKQAFSVGGTDSQACFYAHIDESTFYRYCEKNPEFRKETNRLKEKPILKAKTNIVTELIAGNISISQWYLERRARAEFATRTELGNSDGIPFQLNITDAKNGKPRTDGETEESVDLSS